MSRYIDYDAIDYRNDKMHDKSEEFLNGVIYMAQRIEDAPSIDIVFCRDCHWARPRSLPGETGYRCVLHRIWKGENGFCDSGEREVE